MKFGTWTHLKHQGHIFTQKQTRGKRSAVSGGNAVGSDLYRVTAGNRGTVGGVPTNIRSV